MFTMTVRFLLKNTICFKVLLHLFIEFKWAFCYREALLAIPRSASLKINKELAVKNLKLFFEACKSTGFSWSEELLQHRGGSLGDKTRGKQGGKLATKLRRHFSLVRRGNRCLYFLDSWARALVPSCAPSTERPLRAPCPAAQLCGMEPDCFLPGRLWHIVGAAKRVSVPRFRTFSNKSHSKVIRVDILPKHSSVTSGATFKVKRRFIKQNSIPSPTSWPPSRPTPRLWFFYNWP